MIDYGPVVKKYVRDDSKLTMNTIERYDFASIKGGQCGLPLVKSCV